MTASNPIPRGFYARVGKRWFDIAIASIAVVALFPALAAIAFLVLVIDGWPILFLQRRSGLRGVPFNIWKFRTMAGQPAPGSVLVTARCDVRITKLGQWLRRTKCDELPQLWNVLCGEMSLVGPRPEVPRYTDQYTAGQRQVLQVRPGITGPTAIQHICEEELLSQQDDKEAYYLGVLLPAKLACDLSYCREIGFNEDLKIITKTVLNLLFRFQEQSPSLFSGSANSQSMAKSRESSRGAA